MPLQSYQSKRRKLGSTSTNTPDAAAAAHSSSPTSPASKSYSARPKTPAKRPSTSLPPAKSASASSKSTPKPSSSAASAGTKKRRASVVYVDVSDDDDAALPVYTVEAICKHRKAKDGHYQYWIKWEGYPESQNTWEYDRNVLDKSLIEAYWDSYADNRMREAEEMCAMEKQRYEKAKKQYEEAKRKFVREMSSGQAQIEEEPNLEDEEHDHMDVDDDGGGPMSSTAAESLPTAIRSKRTAVPPPMKKITSLAPNGAPDRRPEKLRRLVTRKERDTRGSSVDTDAKDMDTEMDVDRCPPIDDFAFPVDDDNGDDGIRLTAVLPPTRPRTSTPPPRPRPSPPATERHGASTSSISAASGPLSPSRNDIAQRIADMDQDAIFAFLESRDSPKPEPRFSTEVMRMLNQLTEPELVEMLAARNIHPPDESSYIRPSPSQHGHGGGDGPLPLALAHTNGTNHRDASRVDGDQDVGDDADDGHEDVDDDDEELDEDPDVPHPLAGMHHSLAELLVPIPEHEIMQWVFDRKYEAQISQVVGFDDTSPETQAALAQDGVARAADPLVYVEYKDGSEARVSLGNLIRRAPSVAAEFLLNMRVVIPTEEMAAASQAAVPASQRMLLAHDVFRSPRAVSLPQVNDGSTSDSDDGEDRVTANSADQLDEADELGEQEEHEGRLLDASDVDLASGATPSATPSSAHFRFVRESSQQPMDSPSKVDTRPTAPLTSPTLAARPKLTLYGSGESDSDAEREAIMPGASQTLARSSVSPVSTSQHLPESSARVTPTGQQGVGGLLTSLVQTFTPKRWSVGPEDI
ncbi:hypothetical protein BCR44DRAFT_1424539 [Catenaria anguillulae PL171]|uniref:Chromo domain-containing protein n=1 Tax=Catenaria anguillulae PL171 TaxID=765915 RepID=A0A1Y2HZY5_9FUNG|nr:hypothetical protein BCR44DRAFT_1424539 [Catenaria anguillulae PL171]